jgi:hypothetical protein
VNGVDAVERLYQADPAGSTEDSRGYRTAAFGMLHAFRIDAPSKCRGER